jgi:hypothetical protein
MIYLRRSIVGPESHVVLAVGGSPQYWVALPFYSVLGVSRRVLVEGKFYLNPATPRDCRSCSRQ